MSKNVLAGKRVLIVQQRNWARHTGHLLARKLQQEGCRLAALTIRKHTDRFVRAQTEVTYEHITSLDAIVEDLGSYTAGTNYSLEEIADALGVESIWPIAASHRSLVRSYGDKFFYSFRQHASDETIVLFMKAMFTYVENVFRDFKPDVIVVPNFTSPVHIMLDLYARKRGVKTIAIIDCKIKGISIFTHSFANDIGPLCNRVDALNAGAESTHRERARTYIADFRREFKHPVYMEKKTAPSFVQWVRSELAPYRSVYRWYRKPAINYVPIFGIRRDYRPPHIILRDHYNFKKYKRFAESYLYYPIESIGKAIYLPLQFQPEQTIDVYAPYFNNQIEVARLVAQSLPSDYTLVVKEHPAMAGYRSPSYLEKLARTPNVKLVDYRIPTDTILRKVDLVVSPSSTTIAEAAFYNKPAIQFGILGTTLKLPNVFKHTDMTTLSVRIKDMLAQSFDTDEYERRLENYVAAAYDVGTELDYMSYWTTGKGADPEALWQFYKKEIERVLSTQRV